MTAFYALAGALLVLVVLFEAFEALVLPRRVTRPFRLTRLYYRAAWRAWRALADGLVPGRSRDQLLSAFGPLSLLAMFALWAGGLVLGFGLLHAAAGSASLGEALYLSGAT